MSESVYLAKRPRRAAPGIWIATETRTIERAGVRVEFGPVAFRIASALIAASPNLIETYELWSFVYGDDPDGGPQDRHSLTVYVSILRPKLRSLGIEAEAFFGVGWRGVIVPMQRQAMAA